MKRYKNFGILGAITLIPSKSLYQNQQYVVPRISVLIERLCMFGQIHGRLSPISCIIIIIIIIIIYLLVFKKGRINNSLKCYLCIIFKGNREGEIEIFCRRIFTCRPFMVCSTGYWVTRQFERATVLPVTCCWLKPTRQSSMLEFAPYRNAQTGKGTLVERGDFSLRWTNHIIFETKGLFTWSGGHKTKETYPTRLGSPTPCKQGLNDSNINL